MPLDAGGVAVDGDGAAVEGDGELDEGSGVEPGPLIVPGIPVPGFVESGADAPGSGIPSALPSGDVPLVVVPFPMFPGCSPVWLPLCAPLSEPMFPVLPAALLLPDWPSARLASERVAIKRSVRIGRFSPWSCWRPWPAGSCYRS